MGEPEQNASERNRDNAYYERYCFIQVTCNMITKGQTWNENMNTDKAQWKEPQLTT